MLVVANRTGALYGVHVMIRSTCAIIIISAFVVAAPGCKRVSSKDDEQPKPTTKPGPNEPAATPDPMGSPGDPAGKPVPSNPAPTDPAQPATPAANSNDAFHKGPVSAAALAEATKIFKARCATCHGVSGRGDGPVAKSLRPPPRDYSDIKWQKSVSDAKIATAIVKGGPAVGLKPTMPPNTDLENKPEVVRGLVKLIRGFGVKKK